MPKARNGRRAGGSAAGASGWLRGPGAAAGRLRSSAGDDSATAGPRELAGVLLMRDLLPLVKRLSHARSTRERHARAGDGEAGFDLGVTRTHQRRLRGDDLDVAGHSVDESIAGLDQLLEGQVQALIGDDQALTSRGQVEQGALHLGADLVGQIVAFDLGLALLGRLLREPRFAA